MHRKVFISVLGTNAYGNCLYRKSDESFKCQNSYIQIATLQYLAQRESGFWNEEDLVLMLLTSEAEKKNWLPSVRTNSKTGETWAEPGLERRLKDMHLSAKIEPIRNLPEGDSVEDMMAIFKLVLEKLTWGDELYFDINFNQS